MENALFYTFSTISQTLAGAIGLLGAFVLYRLQAIDGALDDLAVRAIQPYLPDDTARKLRAEAAYSALLKHLSTTPAQDPSMASDPAHVAVVNTLRSHIETIAAIRRSLLWALSLTVITILAAVVVLPLAPRIASQPTIACWVFVVGIALFTGCIALYARLVFMSSR